MKYNHKELQKLQKLPWNLVLFKFVEHMKVL
jgi:hypothetical protein